MPNGQPTSFHPGAPHYSMMLWRIETDLEMECVNKTHWNILSFQERNRAFPPALETRLLCEAGHESHPYRPADDLHASSHVYCHLHEKVMGLSPPSALCFSRKVSTAYPPCWWPPSPVEDNPSKAKQSWICCHWPFRQSKNLLKSKNFWMKLEWRSRMQGTVNAPGEGYIKVKLLLFPTTKKRVTSKPPL